jgi:glycosyltransferase involved in cell wall biosynthesis
VTRENVPAVVRRHDVAFVLSRSNEPFGLVSLEAMASGCAVIASNRGGLPEACGGSAMLVDPDEPDAVVKLLRKLSRDTDLLNVWKQRSISHAARASWETVGDKLNSVLGQML